MGDPTIVALVFLGGGVGSVARWLVGTAIGARSRSRFPLATFIVNVTGCFAMGCLSTMFAVAWQDRLGSNASALILTGMLGGYTTFSSYELDTATTAGDREGRVAAVYWVGSIALGLAAATLGFLVADAFGLRG